MEGNNNHQTAALFDLDGVVFNTEPLYSVFWEERGKRYHPEIEDFEHKIKGQTLGQILDKWFAGQEDIQREIKRDLDKFEREMEYEYVPGVKDFLQSLQEAGIRRAVVTSSDDAKMQNVYRRHPDFASYFDRILTAEFFSRSKPAPDCYLLGAKLFGLPVTRCVVFEDSFNGLKAGRSAGMKVVGLSTTNAAGQIREFCDVVIPNFQQFKVENLLNLLV